VVEFLDVSNMTRYKLHHALSNVLSFSNELFIGCTSCHLAKKKQKTQKKVPCHRTKSVVKYITHTSSKTMHTHLGPSSSSELRPVRLAYQPPASRTFLSEQTSHQQPASSTLLSEQTSTSHQPPANRTGC
jgi:hypothetical protein